MTMEEYNRIWEAFIDSRQTARGTMLEGLTAAERSAAYEADDAAYEEFHAAMAAARADITIPS